MNYLSEAHGWRAGFQLIAAYMLIFGLVTSVLIPKEADANLARNRTRGAAKRDYQAILRAPAFWILLSALILCNLSQVLHASQLELLLLAKGATSETASTIFSLYAVGVMVGRFGSGLALDRFPAYVVAAVGLALPGVGMFLLASSLSAPVVLTISLLTMGLALGAEGDVMGYLTVRYFGVRRQAARAGSCGRHPAQARLHRTHDCAARGASAQRASGHTHIPAAWRFVAALPRNRSVKVDRPALRKLFEPEPHANLR